mgnify:FL=1
MDLDIFDMDNIDISNGIATLSKVLFFRRLESRTSTEHMIQMLQMQMDITECEARQLLCSVAIGPMFNINEENAMNRIIEIAKNKRNDMLGSVDSG